MMLKRLMNLASCCCLVLVVAVVLGPAAVGADSLPRRQTADWQADLISGLIDTEMFDSAEAICTRHYRRAEVSTDQAARWAIRWSAVRAARIPSSTDWQLQQASAARQPIEELLQSYPDHPRALWLQAQLGIVDMATVHHTALALAIAADQDDLRARGLNYVSSALRQWEAVADQIKTLNPASDEELHALQETIRKQRVEALLWRSRMFIPASEDAIASATEAEGEARQTLAQMSPGSQTHRSIMRLRAEALTAMGSPDQALQVLEDIQRSAGGELSTAGLALQVRALLAKQDWVSAAKQLNAYYGAAPEQAPSAPDLDLARLAYLLVTVDQENAVGASETGVSRDQRLREVADWLDAIERRNGLYARRRGEAETLRVVRVHPDRGDTRLLAAEAARQLRSGHARQAGELLAQAAAATSDAAQALRYAAQSAAVLKSVGRMAQAAEVLTATAMRHSQHESAPGLHLQAAWLTAEAMKQDGDADIAVLQSILEATARRWPAATEFKTAVDWLVRLLEASEQYEQAAGWLLSEPYPVSASSIHQAGRLWQAALRASGGDRQLLERAIASLQTPSPEEPAEFTEARAVQRLRLAALFADVDDLRRRYADVTVATDDAFAASLLKFRRDRTAADTLVISEGNPSIAAEADWKNTAADAVARLQRDGQSEAAERARLGQGIIRLLDSLGPATGGRQATGDHDVRRGQALAWAGQWQQADQLFQDLLRRSPADLTVIRAAAEGLGESASADAKRRAIEYWSKIAAGVPQGSESWHEAKLATIRLHLAVREAATAAQLCRYVLLTRPPADTGLRDQYEQLLQQASAEQ